ncbi:formin-like protein 20 [Benincasa hispida]|uniref:formin-like protein 20 n=1 Tax=Benincasa hispida TaxID=102211 RepID=UPI001902541F|nr:formin-like protein 20 [Benincasa hispida]
MESSTTSFKDNEKPTAACPTRGTVYPPPPHYGGGHPPAGYAPPPPMPGYGGHLSPPPPYSPFPPPYNIGPYTPPPQPYGYPHHPPPPPAYGYAPPPGNRPAGNAPTKKKKSGMSKILGMGAGLVGGLLLGELAADGGAVTPSFDLFSDPTGGGGLDYDASMQSMSDSMDLLGTIG